MTDRWLGKAAHQVYLFNASPFLFSFYFSLSFLACRKKNARARTLLNLKATA